MAIPFFEEDLDIISRLGDYPGSEDGLTPEDFKARFDLAGNLIKKFLNEVIIPNFNIAIDVEELTSYILEKVLNLSGGMMRGDIDMNGHKITYLKEPTDSGDAATKKYVDDAKDTMEYVYKTIELPSGNWNNNQQTITVSGVTNNIDLTVTPSPTRENATAYSEAGVICTASDNNKLTFECTDVPSVSLSVNIKYRNLGG